MSREKMIAIGKIIKVRGAKGELTFSPLTDDIKRFFILKEVFIEKLDGTVLKKDIEKISFYNEKGIIKFCGIESGREAMEFLKAFISIPEGERIALPENHYFISDLIGAEVISLEGEILGKVVDIFPTGSNDVFVVRNKNKETLIPAIKNVIKHVNIEDKKITINLLEGL